MTLASDLLDQADALAVLDGNRPKQASLRRAVSASYYSLFHLLTREVSTYLSPHQRFVPFVARALDHAKAKQAANWIVSARATSQLPLDQVLVHPINGELTGFCSTFMHLQQLRHRADYDFDYRITRADCLMELGRARNAHLEWRRQRGSANARALLLHALGALKAR